MRRTTIQKYRYKGAFLASTLAATLLALFSACKNHTSSSSWEEPVHDYFEKYTNTAAIEKQEINAANIKDKNGYTCISSDGDKTLTFYMRNPRQYTLLTNFSQAIDNGITIEQDMQDKTIIRVTYPQAFLQAHEGGQQIGGTIYLTESETLRQFDSYSFELKCNTPPPAVTKQCVNASGGTYWVCFWLPTAQFAAGQIHSDTKIVHIEGITGKSVAISDLATATDGNPGDLASIDGTFPFAEPTSGDYTAFCYNTQRAFISGENLEWRIYLEDEDGLKSETMAASTSISPVTMTINGGDLITTNAGENNVQLTASVDSPVASWSWTSSNPSIASLPENTNSSSVTVTAVEAGGGGEATITCTANLADGRSIQSTKTIRVLDLILPGIEINPQDFAKGQTGVQLNAIAPDFATLTWSSSAPGIAAISEGGVISAQTKGSAIITASASYGGKTVSKEMTVYVHEFTVNNGSDTSDVTELFVGGSHATFTASIEPATGRESMTSYITYDWSASGSAVSIGGGGAHVTVTPESAGTTTLTCTTNLNGMTIPLPTKTINVYAAPSIEIVPPTSYNSANSDPDANLYALTSLFDTFTFKVPNADSTFPSGTTFTWTVEGNTLTAPTQHGSSVSLAMTALNITSIPENKNSPRSISVSCKAKLPSNKESQEVEENFSIYQLTIPDIVINIENEPTDLKPNSSTLKYCVGKYNLNASFKLTAKGQGGSDIPSGATYRWEKNGLLLVEGTDKQTINPTITQLRNLMNPPTSDESYPIKCIVSLTGCTSKDDTQTLTFAKRTPLGAPTLDGSVTASVESGKPGYLVGSNGTTFTFSSNTNIEDVQIKFKYTRASGDPNNNNNAYVYSIYKDSSHITTYYNDYLTPTINGDKLGSWDTPYTISVEASLTPSNPAIDYSDRVDLFTVTITRESP
ncbi:MAG: hypothetical protein J6X11_14635 [Treponema sp.]|nr:hypothetical protein [Treponema sp.]